MTQYPKNNATNEKIGPTGMIGAYIAVKNIVFMIPAYSCYT